jgi:hypothetical protein
MRRARIKTEQEIEKFRKLQEKIEDLVREKHSAETDYGEIPEEFKGSDHAVLFNCLCIYRAYVDVVATILSHVSSLPQKPLALCPSLVKIGSD